MFEITRCQEGKPGEECETCGKPFGLYDVVSQVTVKRVKRDICGGCEAYLMSAIERTIEFILFSMSQNKK